MDNQLTILLPNYVPLEMTLVQPGHFIMVDDGLPKRIPEPFEYLIHISESFYIGKYPVTQAQWQAIMGSNPSSFTGLQRPVENVSWFDIMEDNRGFNSTPAFLTLLNRHLTITKATLAATHQFRLPTDAEWVYAAKGGQRCKLAELKSKKVAVIHADYAGSDRLESCGWFDKNANFETRPVGLKTPNELGLYDMCGNIEEWCLDFYDFPNFENKKEMLIFYQNNTHSELNRVMRGGSFRGDTKQCCFSYRRHGDPWYGEWYVGFRLVLSPWLG